MFRYFGQDANGQFLLTPEYINTIRRIKERGIEGLDIAIMSTRRLVL